MRITIIAIGSRGDIQPYIALSKGLIDAGYTVRMATHSAFATLLHSYAIPFFPLDNDQQEFFQSQQAKNAFLDAHQLATLIEPLVSTYMERCEEACQDAELIIVTYMSFLIGYSTAEKLGKSLVATFLQPSLLPTKYLPEPTSPNLPQRPAIIGHMLNYQSHLAAGAAFWRLFTPAVNVARQKIYHLPPLPRKSLFASLPDHVDLILYAYSPLFIPRPADWGETTIVTGFWFLDAQQEWQPDPTLVDFLQAGHPPVYIGFGSMNPYRSDKTIGMIREALVLSQQRGIVLVEKEYGHDQRLADNLYITNGLPHEWLFPRMRTIVHHGRAGTTAASLRAGVPTVTVPYLADQKFWGECVARLGAGPKPLVRQHLSAKKLANQLRRAETNQTMRQRAQEVSAQLRKENGVAQAVKAIQTHLPRPKM